MQEKGAVTTFTQDGKRAFAAVHPEVLREQMRMQLENFERAVPDLIKRMDSAESNVSISLHKGRRVYRTLLKDTLSTLESGSEVRLIGIDENELEKEVEPIYLKQYLTAIKERKIVERAIIRQGEKRLRSKQVSYRTLPEIGNVGQILYADKVAIFVNGTPRHLILLQGAEIASTYGLHFELLWNIAKPAQ